MMSGVVAFLFYINRVFEIVMISATGIKVIITTVGQNDAAIIELF